MTHLTIYEAAPDFTLKDCSGAEVSLSDFKGSDIVLLVFNRGFTWPFCRRHMAQLRRDHHRFVQRKTQIIAIGPESSKTFCAYWGNHNMPFIGLPDPNHSVLEIYGQEFKLLQLGRMPAQVIIDSAGIVRHTHYGHSMIDIPVNDRMLDIIDREFATNTL